MVGYLGFLHTDSPTTRQFALQLNENLEKAVETGASVEDSPDLRLREIARELLSESD